MSDRWCSNTHTLPQRSFAAAHNRHACNQLLQVAVYQVAPWAARYNTWLLIELTPKGVVFSSLFFSVSGCKQISKQADKPAAAAAAVAESGESGFSINTHDSSSRCNASKTVEPVSRPFLKQGPILLPERIHRFTRAAVVLAFRWAPPTPLQACCRADP